MCSKQNKKRKGGEPKKTIFVVHLCFFFVCLFVCFDERISNLRSELGIDSRNKVQERPNPSADELTCMLKRKLLAKNVGLLNRLLNPWNKSLEMSNPRNKSLEMSTNNIVLYLARVIEDECEWKFDNWQSYDRVIEDECEWKFDNWQSYDGGTGQRGGGEKAGCQEAGNPGMNREWKNEEEVREKRSPRLVMHREKRSPRLVCTMHWNRAPSLDDHQDHASCLLYTSDAADE